MDRNNTQIFFIKFEHYAVFSLTKRIFVDGQNFRFILDR